MYLACMKPWIQSHRTGPLKTERQLSKHSWSDSDDGDKVKATLLQMSLHTWPYLFSVCPRNTTLKVRTSTEPRGLPTTHQSILRLFCMWPWVPSQEGRGRQMLALGSGGPWGRSKHTLQPLGQLAQVCLQITSCFHYLSYLRFLLLWQTP